MRRHAGSWIVLRSIVLDAKPIAPVTRASALSGAACGALLAILLGAACFAGAAQADGVVTLADGDAGPYRVIVRVSPARLRVGSSEWSVLVRDAPAGGLCLDCRVRIELKETKGHGMHAHHNPHNTGGVEARRSRSKNRVLHTARIDLAAEGDWSVRIDVQGPNGPGRLDFDVAVAPKMPLLARHPWALIWPVIALALFGLHQSRSR